MPADRLSDRMVFLVGAPRSGTNWLQRMLAAHPEIVTLPSETHLFSYGLQHLDEQVQHGLLTSPATGKVFLPREEWVQEMRKFCVLVYGRVADSINPSARLVVERSPQHVMQLALIGEVFPDASIVHIVRDGRDVARSLASREWGPRGVRLAAEQWREAVTAARAAAPSLARYREVRYEELMSDPRGQVADTFRWLGVAATDEVLDNVALAAGMRFNVDPSSPKIAVGKWAGEWTAAQLRDFDEVAGQLRRELGYPDAGLVRRPAKVRVAAAVHRFRHRRTRAASAEQRPVVTSHEAIQIAVDAFLAAAATGRLPDGLPTDVSVSWSEPGGSWQGRGSAALARLAGALAAEGDWGRQVRSTEHLLGPTVAVAVTNESAAGDHTDRVVLLGFAPTGVISHIGYMRFVA